MKYFLILLLLVLGCTGGNDKIVPMEVELNHTYSVSSSNEVLVLIDKYKINYKIHLMPHVKLDSSIIHRSVLAPSAKKSEYKFDGTVFQGDSVVAFLSDISARKFLKLYALIDGEPKSVVTLKSRSDLHTYYAEEKFTTKKRIVRVDPAETLETRTVKDTLFVMHKQKQELIIVGVGGKTTLLRLPLYTEPYTAIWAVYASPSPADMGDTWAER